MVGRGEQEGHCWGRGPQQHPQEAFIPAQNPELGVGGDPTWTHTHGPGCHQEVPARTVLFKCAF